MPQFKLPVVDGPIAISLYDGGLVREHTWHVKDGVTHVAEDDIEFFTKHFASAVPVHVSDKQAEEAPRTHAKAGTSK